MYFAQIFGEVVLGLSQGSVSELLSKPKPWHMLSIKGREPFIRMQLWLSDPYNIDRLQALRNERREATKRRRAATGSGGGSAGSGGGGAGLTGSSACDNSSDTSSNDTSEFYHSTSPGPPAKKQRVLFSEEQKEALRIAFALDSYPNLATIEFLASELNLSARTITNWFHNHRMRLKQQVPHEAGGNNGASGTLPASTPTPSGQPFDPVRFRMLLNQRLVELQKERMAVGGVQLPSPYPPYFGANPNLAALIQRSFISGGGAAAAAAAAAAGFGVPPSAEPNGLDLSIKRDSEDDFEDNDVISNPGSDDSGSDSAVRRGKVAAAAAAAAAAAVAPRSSSSRRKPAAPQWVNPDWQESAKDSEVIINGVCVMQTDDYGSIKMADDEETVRVEPTAVMDRYDDGDGDGDGDDDSEDGAPSPAASPQVDDSDVATAASPSAGIAGRAGDESDSMVMPPPASGSLPGSPAPPDTPSVLSPTNHSSPVLS